MDGRGLRVDILYCQVAQLIVSPSQPVNSFVISVLVCVFTVSEWVTVTVAVTVSPSFLLSFVPYVSTYCTNSTLAVIEGMGDYNSYTHQSLYCILYVIYCLSACLSFLLLYVCLWLVTRGKYFISFLFQISWYGFSLIEWKQIWNIPPLFQIWSLFINESSLSKKFF
jgi:hypothetical protein